MAQKVLIYQAFPRLFGNSKTTRKPHGTLQENGVGKLSAFDEPRLRRIAEMGFTHIWYTGVIRHATATDYSAYGIPRQHPQVVKGKAGSPYAITDYYDVDPDLADDVEHRMEEFEALVTRSHEKGLKVIIDFVPNHVARQYHSICAPKGVKDLGAGDDQGMHFSTKNNFYYCPNQPFRNPVSQIDGMLPYTENPAKCTGNNRFDYCPSVNDWYETVKLNYGINYTDWGGQSKHFAPVPSTWKKMTAILLFWAAKGIDGFRCDMAEMVPVEFWQYATERVRETYPKIDFVGEVYDTNQYRNYIRSGFTYLYDKVGMYDCIRDVICNHRPASSITYYWQCQDDISSHMLYFLENHDEQRIASSYFCGDAHRAIPGVIVSALMRTNPFMLYQGQEFGEAGMDAEGFSGLDGRTTIFDYWQVDKVYRGYFDRSHLSHEELALQLTYQEILQIARHEKAVSEGAFFDLMYVNPYSEAFDPHRHYAFLRKHKNSLLLVVANFSDQTRELSVTIPNHAFDLWELPERMQYGIDLLSGDTIEVELKRDRAVRMMVPAYGGVILKLNIAMEENGYVLNEHNKDEFPPAHTAEHLLNRTMVNLFGCERSSDAHIERKKSKMNWTLKQKPTRNEEKAIVQQMNELIAADLPVSYEYVDRDHLPEGVDASRLPSDSSDTIRLVRIGDYDVCPCIGKHVRSTGQIGKFELLGTSWNEHERRFRIRFKVVP